jgi:hypothetical protein
MREYHREFPNYGLERTAFGVRPIEPTPWRHPITIGEESADVAARMLDIKKALVACLEDLDARGMSNQEIITALLYLAIHEAFHAGYSSKQLQDLVGGFGAAMRPPV